MRPRLTTGDIRLIGDDTVRAAVIEYAGRVDVMTPRLARK
jgi:hypothetical protein